MPAPKGNQFWKLQSKHGRDKLFATPELLWETACEYFQWCDDNPLQENKVINSSKEGIKDHPVNKMRAYTLNGLFLYFNCTDSYFRAFKAQERKNKEAYITVITRIEKTIYEQKFTGAAADLLNPNIIARDLGLIDKKETTGEQTIIWKEEKTYEAHNKADDSN